MLSAFSWQVIEYLSLNIYIMHDEKPDRMKSKAVAKSGYSVSNEKEVQAADHNAAV